ncbi:MAP kinase kinase 10 [Tasmannia lanceolata]|uniref:MAP kinase kinase 10 n=1 Tax=Tasmannia lanceolata TaxID=3420 RepID=UPI00406327DA
MTLVRERRHQQALHLPLPVLRNVFPFPLPLPPLRPDSPVNLSDLEKLTILGQGNEGTVYKVRHRRNSTIFALKVLRLNEDPTTIRQQATREAEILKRVNSPFIVHCHGVFDNGNLCFVMEYMDAGSLHDLLQIRRRLPEKLISDIGRRVLEGLKYLHGMRIVHRDIKPSNLLINGRGEVKIADFGVSQVVAGAHDFACCDTYVGTCAYMSPERFDTDRCGGEYDGFPGDVWALGVALLECHVGYYPLLLPGQRPDWGALMCAICFGELPEMLPTASPEFRSFVRRCLDREWRKRATVKELLSHPFVAKCPSSTQGLVDALHG